MSPAKCWYCGDSCETTRWKNRDVCFPCLDEMTDDGADKPSRVSDTMQGIQKEEESGMKCEQCGKDRTEKQMGLGPDKPCNYCRMGDSKRKQTAKKYGVKPGKPKGMKIPLDTVVPQTYHPEDAIRDVWLQEKGKEVAKPPVETKRLPESIMEIPQGMTAIQWLRRVADILEAVNL